MAGRNKPIIFVEFEGGCQVPLSHALNQDGYFRKGWGSHENDTFVQEMFHRFVWRARYGEIPEGFEVDHLCNCRACCNPGHLQAIDGTEHAIKSNRERYAKRIEEGKRLIQKGLTYEEIGVKLSVTVETVKRWNRQLKVIHM